MTWVKFKQRKGSIAHYFDISPELDKALLLSDIAMQHWFTYLTMVKEGRKYHKATIFDKTDAASRQKVIKYFRVRGSVDLLRELLNADAMWRGEYHAVIRRAHTRQGSLQDHIEHFTSDQGARPDYVTDCKRKLKIVNEFLKELDH